ncbi:esterase family protein [Streptomyces sp. NBC_00091]|uniref:alpha/beta hydrolase n=1 Tax=Streptomyces sp. NBC_00091 TaxID=2975648 RepID=UPI0022528EA5|nr:alpha/beta hydrolase-fold protein [Streptomyces sp. NBC_00091]MCX5378262.1 esterase family protein [Streptomyces sp. NBC_00091]
MGLTSSTLLVSAVLCTVLLFAATVWLWPRLARSSRGLVLGRLGLLVVVQVFLFASVALAANRSFLIYGSWADLTAGQARQEAVPGGAAVEVLGRQDTGVPGGRSPQSGGLIEKVTLHGERSRVAAQAYVYLPPEYFQKGNEQRKFPAAVVLTGYPGTAENLLKGLRYPKTAWTQAKQKKMQPMILVMMRPVVGPSNSQCVDVPGGGPQSESFFGTDVPRAVASHYRIGTSARNWAIIGDSTGGYCALKMTLQHPETYAAGVGLSADYKPEVDADSGDLFHGNKGEEKRSDLLWHLANRPQPNVSFLVTTSLQGESNLKATQQFVKAVKDPAHVSSITLDRGGHSFNTWNREIPPALAWTSARLSAN